MNRQVTSAGGVVVRPSASGWETLLVGNSNPTIWRIPKGMRNGNETLEQTALREVREESGVTGIILTFVGAIGWTYAYGGQDWDETVFFFLMKCAEEDIASHDEEFDKVEWVKLEDAIRVLHYRNEAEIVEKAAALLEDFGSQFLGPENHVRKKSGPIERNRSDILNFEELRLLGSGLSLGIKTATGRVVTDATSLHRFLELGDPVIFITDELAPRNAPLFMRSQGLVAAKGGITSHMAVVMRGLRKACICGIQDLFVMPESSGFQLRDQIIGDGEWLTIDERSGGIYLGRGQLRSRPVSEEADEIVSWAHTAQRVKVLVNADDDEQVKYGLLEGADGVGLVRSEHQILSEELLEAFRCLLLVRDTQKKSVYNDKITATLERRLVEMLKVLDGKPIHYRLLDAPINEFLPFENEPLASLAESTGVTEGVLQNQISRLRETNSLFGCRGSRWGLVHQEFYKRQIELALRAARNVAAEDVAVALTIVVPMISAEEELKYWYSVFQQELARNSALSCNLTIRFGAMIETPRAALSCAGLAKYADTFCIGTNDLTQAVWAMSRDDVSAFYSQLLTTAGISFDPFRILDRVGVGVLLEQSIADARRVRPDAQFYVCGEHASDPDSVRYLIGLGVDGLSCAPEHVSNIKVVAALAGLVRFENSSTQWNILPRRRELENSSDILERIIAEVNRSNYPAAQKAAMDWAGSIAEDLGLKSPTVWKYFKRDLVEKWFGAGERKRFEPGWDTGEAVAYATSHSMRKVRYSVFPADIACHARSKALPEDTTMAEWRAELDALDHSIAVEIFPQQPEDNLCFRARFEGDDLQLEAGLGQAMYVFEEERGRHPFVQGFFDVASCKAKVTGRNENEQATASIEKSLTDLLSLYGSDLLRNCREICDTLQITWIAIEGYYDFKTQAYPFVCDLDLPQDLAFHVN
jgi:phosphoenolpyruvate-protein kinase (PTS system EI component)/8-oxo-dGTP pyrophosphatase MutT (NUDIX family)